MEVSARAKDRFCKDCNIPIKLFQEPYFTDRLKLFDKFYGTLKKWDTFTKELEKYNCEQDYFEEYNRVKDSAILSIKNSEAYQKFNEEDMNKFSVTHKNLPNRDIFKMTNDGRTFISIDMKKANFSSLCHYDKNIFSGATSWEEFISKFTNNKHIINSKYIRQVILGNCNPKRHITYEKYLMDNVLSTLVPDLTSIEDVVFFSNDEIVLDISDLGPAEQIELRNKIEGSLKDLTIPFRVELFTLHKIENTDGYYKEVYSENKDEDKKIVFKCLDCYTMPFVIRTFLGEEITENDKVFYHEGLLAKYIEVPKITTTTKGGVNHDIQGTSNRKSKGRI